MSGVLIEKNEQGHQIGTYVHLWTDEWCITSNHAVDAPMNWSVCERTLPGRLGAYVYPNDAIFAIHGKAQTRVVDLNEAIATERSARRDSTRVNHISISEITSEVAHVSDEEEDEEEDEEDNECDDDKLWVDDDEEEDADE